MTVFCVFKASYGEPELHNIFADSDEAGRWCKLMNESQDTEDFIVDEWEVL